MGDLLGSATTLPGGLRVRLRLPNGTDRAALRRLAARSGIAADEAQLARLLRFDPRRRTVAVASAWVGGHDVLVGAGTVERSAGAEPRVVFADEDLAPGIGALLTAALGEWAVPVRDWAA